MDISPGPVDASVLYEQDKHVSAAVWDGQERGALRCHEHTSKLGEWRLTRRQIELVEISGFGHLRKIPAISLDNPLISALVERWRKETNTFHFTIGEMTVTLQDVALLLGLAIDGKPVIGITHTTCAAVCEKLLGKAPDSNYASGGMVKLSWLKEFFSQCSEDSPEEEVQQCTRAYLLYLVGSTIFSTTTGNKVPVMYLPLFENLEICGEYAWGAAALAFLYRALGNACVKSQSTICGCLTLLQVCWSYFHLNIGRPKLNRDPIHDNFPFVLKWKGKQSGPTTNRDVVFYRKALDTLKTDDVEWLPYKYMDTTSVPEAIQETLILGRSKTMLICFDKAERHLPDRCLRQYGMCQPIPEDVPRWVRKSRGVDGGVDLSGKMESELSEWANRYLHIVEGIDAMDEAEYIQWYLRITRKVVGRPISLSTEFQRTIAGLREIAYLADSFSTKGLDGQQFESISRIRYIAQDCLRDQSGSPATTAVSIDTPTVELGKRIRGKERVRRKGSGKRRRKDELVEYQDGSDDETSQFYAGVEVDPLHVIPTDVEVAPLQASEMDVDAQLLSRFSGEGGYTELPDVVDKVIDGNNYYSADDYKVSQACEVNNGAHSSSPDATFEVKDSLVCDRTTDSKPDDASKELNESKLFDDRVDKVSDPQLFNGANGTVNYVTNEEVGNPQFHDAVGEVTVAKLFDATGMTGESKSPDAAGDVELADAGIVIPETQNHADSTTLACDSKLPSESEVARDLQKPADAASIDRSTQVGSESQLSAGTIRDGNDLNPPDMKAEADQFHVCDASNGEKVEDLHFADESKSENVSTQPHATKDDRDSRLPVAANDPSTGKSSAVETVKDSAN
ncbi:Protein MAIN-LIKE 2 [Linum perenne]